MRILVTNDDGIHAPGLDVAEKIARALSEDVWVVAPESEQSGASHSLTLAGPLRLRQARERLEPVRYLQASYYEQWLLAIQRLLDEKGIIRRSEIEARMRQLAQGAG